MRGRQSPTMRASCPTCGTRFLKKFHVFSPLTVLRLGEPFKDGSGQNRVAGVIRSNPSPIALLTPVGRRGGAVCFVSGATPEKKKRKMDEDEVEDEEQHTDSDNTYQGDAMRHSFGEGYSTRSDWEGFGGIYGRNPSGYDKAQGSEVKEKEKAPNEDT